ncbi:MAG: class I SAM-dependent methyltransferase [Rhizobiales bacterium]|nr:class I SAM-dependent methyltransferase [Hyphomicrobiales bacterium]
MTSKQRPGVDVKTGYDAWARNYDDMDNATRDLDATALRQTLASVSANDVLELGCGTGKNTAWLANQFGHVTAVDFSASMLNVARQKASAKNISFYQYDISKPWPADSTKFDLVTCNLVLEHIADLHFIYKEAERVLRPGGQLFLCELHPYRQLKGGQAQYVSRTGDSIPIATYVHSFAEFINEALAVDLVVSGVKEWHAPSDDMPRLLSLLFVKR